LPDTDEITADAVKAEEMLAELEANSELVGSVAMSAGSTGLTAEEQALFDELEAENKQEKGEADAASEASAPAAQRSGATPATAQASEAARQRQGAQSSSPPPIPSQSRRSEPEAG
jgi:hypothetical protein